VHDPVRDAFVVGGNCCGGVQDFIDVRIGPDGTPWGAFVDDCLGEGNKCLAAIQADPSYRACSCASFPNVRNECYGFCGSAHDRSKGCSTAGLVRDCRSDGDRCRSRCQ
jgi:hypothetical protein